MLSNRLHKSIRCFSLSQHLSFMSTCVAANTNNKDNNLTCSKPLWWELFKLQDEHRKHLFCSRKEGDSGTTISNSTSSAIRFSIVVVPPPVPEAIPRFEEHLRTCIKGAPKISNNDNNSSLIYCTVTSRTPYFFLNEHEDLKGFESDKSSANNSSISDDSSRNKKDTFSLTQRAIDYIHQDFNVPVILTVTATMCTHFTINSNNINENENKSIHFFLTGATKEGIKEIGDDFFFKRNGRGLMVLRGDDGNYNLKKKTETITSCSKESDNHSPYKDFSNGEELLAFINKQFNVKNNESNDIPLTLCVGGYPQGHPMDRLWDVQGDNNNNNNNNNNNILKSLTFLAEKLKLPATTEESKDKNKNIIVIEAAIKKAKKALLLASTPSLYPIEEINHINCDVNKIIKHNAKMVVTQMISSADEFLEYAAVIEDKINEHNNNNNNKIKALIIPGIMVPLKAEDYAHVILMLKIIPPSTLKQGLEEYIIKLENLLHLHNISSRSNRDHNILLKEKMKAENEFLDLMHNYSIEMVKKIIHKGYNHFNISAFNYSSSSSVVQLMHDIYEEK